MASESFEILDKRFKRSVKVDEPIERIWSEGRWTEGPVYSPSFKSLIWSDIPNDRQMRWDETTGKVGIFQSNHGRYVNGSTMDRQGRMVSCEHGTRSVVRVEHDGSLTVLAESYQGNRFNSPNDVVVKSDDSVWFTDPAYGIESDYEGALMGLHFRLMNRSSISRIPAARAMKAVSVILGFSMSWKMAVFQVAKSSLNVLMVFSMVSGWTTKGGSGPAQWKVFTAITLMARCSARSLFLKKYPTFALVGPSATVFS